VAIAFDAAVAFDSPDYTFDGVFTGVTPPTPTPAEEQRPGGTYWRQPPDNVARREKILREDDELLVLL
jgi:hypothetical protein